MPRSGWKHTRPFFDPTGGIDFVVDSSADRRTIAGYPSLTDVEQRPPRSSPASNMAKNILDAVVVGRGRGRGRREGLIEASRSSLVFAAQLSRPSEVLSNAAVDMWHPATPLNERAVQRQQGVIQWKEDARNSASAFVSARSALLTAAFHGRDGKFGVVVSLGRAVTVHTHQVMQVCMNTLGVVAEEVLWDPLEEQ